MPVPPPTQPSFPPNPQGPLAPGSGAAGTIGGLLAPSGSPSKGCGFVVQIGGIYDEWVKILDVDPNAKCPGNLIEKPTSGPGSSGGLPGTGDLFTSLGKASSWFSSAEHWKGVGLLIAAGVVGVIGLVLWTGHGGDTVRVATQTGERMALA